MATSMKVGFIDQINDKKASWKKRVKIVSKALDSPDLYVPNKHQVCLDWLCNTISNRKKNGLDAEELSGVWRLLASVLACTSKPVLMKNSFSQVLQNCLNEVVENPGCPSYTSIMECLQAVFSHHSTIFTSTYEHMVLICSSILTMTCHHIIQGCDVPDITKRVTQLVLEIYARQQRLQANQKQVLHQTAEFLLKPSLVFCHLANLHQNKSDDLVIHRKMVEEILLKAFFHKDHESSYNIILSSDEHGNITKQKALTHIFDKLKDLVDTQTEDKVLGKCHEASINFLSSLLSGYHVQLKPSLESGLAFQMFCWIFKLLQLDGSACKLKALHQMLTTVSNEDIYSPGMDNTSGNTQLKFLQNLVSLSLKVDHGFCAVWFDNWYKLLQLNHMVLDGKLVDILQAVWFNKEKLNTESEKSQGHLLCSFVDTYSKLRQFPKFISKLFDALRTSEVNTLKTIPRAVLNKFGLVCEQLPQLTTVDMWGMFIGEFHKEFISKVDIQPSKMTFLTSLFNEFLLNIKVADYSITDNTALKVQTSMNHMRDRIVLPLLNKFLRNQRHEVGACCLQLMHTWGELMLLLRYHTQSKGAECSAKLSSAVGFEDLNYVHTYLGKEMSFMLGQKSTSGDHCLRYHFMSLVIQKLRAMLLFIADHNSSSFVTSVHNCLDFLFHKLDSSKNQAVWDWEPDSLTAHSTSVSQWSLILQGLPLYVSYMTADQLDVVAKFLTNNWTSAVVNSPTASYVTTNQLNQQFLQSSSFLELSRLLSAIITAVWQGIVGTMRGSEAAKSSEKTKKKRKTTGDNALLVLIESNVGTGTMDKLKYVSTSDCVLVSNCVAKLTGHLKILKEMPLENLNELDATKCIANLLPLLFVSSNQTNSAPDNAELTNLCAELCCILLDGDHVLPLFSTYNSGELLSRLAIVPSEGLYIRMLFKKLVALATREESSLKGLESCIKQISTMISEKGLVANNTVLQFAPCLINSLVRLMLKTYVSESVRNLAQQYYTTITHSILPLVEKLAKVKSPLNYMGSVMECFNIILWYLCVTQSQELQDVNKVVVKMVAQVTGLLQQPGSLVELLSPSLRFSQIMFEFREKFSNLENIDNFSTGFWKMFITLFQNVQHPMLEKTPKELNSTEVTKRNILNNSRLASDLQALVDCDSKLQQEVSNSGVLGNSGIGGGDEGITSELNKTFVVYVASLDVKEFTAIVHSVISLLQAAKLLLQASRCEGYRNQTSACLLWSQFLEMDLGEEKYRILSLNTQNILISFQAMMLSLSTERYTSTVHKVVVSILNTLTTILTQQANSLPKQSIELCLHILQHTRMTGLSLTEFSEVVHAYHGVLNEVLIQHNTAALSMIPSFLHCAKNLMCATIMEGRQRSEVLHQDSVEILVKCTHLVERLFALIITYKTEFSKVAIYAIVDYVNEVQKVTLIPAVKKSLLPAIYKLLDICDEHSIAQLHTILTAGVKEIFKSIYAEYTKYHRYKGRV